MRCRHCDIVIESEETDKPNQMVICKCGMVAISGSHSFLQRTGSEQTDYIELARHWDRSDEAYALADDVRIQDEELAVIALAKQFKVTDGLRRFLSDRVVEDGKRRLDARVIGYIRALETQINELVSERERIKWQGAEESQEPISPE